MVVTAFFWRQTTLDGADVYHVQTFFSLFFRRLSTYNLFVRTKAVNCQQLTASSLNKFWTEIYIGIKEMNFFNFIGKSSDKRKKCHKIVRISLINIHEQIKCVKSYLLHSTCIPSSDTPLTYSDTRWHPENINGNDRKRYNDRRGEFTIKDLSCNVQRINDLTRDCLQDNV